MAFERWGYQFDGGYISSDDLQTTTGVYVIWCRNGDDWRVLDVGESDNVRNRIKNHERANCWQRNCTGTIYFSATYTPYLDQAGRREIETRIRSLVNVICGEF